MRTVAEILEWQLSSQDDAAIADLLVAAFDEYFQRRSYHKQRHHLRFVCRDDGRIIGHLALCFRDVRLGDTLVTIAGLGEVATEPAYQGQGVATALMAAALDTAHRSNAVFLLLFGTRPIYAGSGFVAANNPMRWVGMDDAVTGQTEVGQATDLMVLPLRPGTAWDAQLTLDLLGHLF